MNQQTFKDTIITLFKKNKRKSLINHFQEQSMTLALFDLDNTLLEGDSDYEWGEFLVKNNLVNKKQYAESNRYFFEEYKKGTLDIIEYSAFSFKPLASRNQSELNTIHKEFMRTSIIPIIKPKSREKIKHHQQQGHTIILITATNTFIGTPIAQYLDIKHIIATQPKIINERYTTEIEGTPCFQEGKVTRLNEWMTRNNKNLKGSYFYTDSINDLALLEAVENPIVVDPDDKLKEVASKRKWMNISLR